MERYLGGYVWGEGAGQGPYSPQASSNPLLLGCRGKGDRDMCVCVWWGWQERLLIKVGF